MKKLLQRLLGRNKTPKGRPEPKSEAEKARELEQLVQTGVAMNKPPTVL
jgi:hypothetical protein